jgi:hypothetical protein
MVTNLDFRGFPARCSVTDRRRGGDPTIGPRLAALLRVAGFEDVREDTVPSPMTTAGQKLFLVELLDGMREAMLEAGVTTVERVSSAQLPTPRRFSTSGARAIHQALVSELEEVTRCRQSQAGWTSPEAGHVRLPGRGDGGGEVRADRPG